jgi:hypothetical protein
MKKFFLALALLSAVAMLAGCLPAKEEAAPAEEGAAVEESTVAPETAPAETPAEAPAETPAQ